MTSKIKDFFRCSFNDKRLPVEFDIGTGVIKFVDTGIPNIIRYSQLEKCAKVFDDWKSSEIHEFCDNQWRFNCLQLVRNVDGTYGESDDGSSIVPRFPPRKIFPLKVLGKPIGTPFSKVWKVQDISGFIDWVFLLKTLDYLDRD